MVLFPEEEAVRERVVEASVALAKEISKEGSNPPDGPDTLFHYTDAPGLIGILEHSTVWLSRAATLNDPRELSYGWGVARNFVAERWNDLAPRGATDSPTGLFYGNLVEVMKSNLRRPDKLGDFARLDPFVACFCEAPDLLSQWNYYSRDGGYCIGFERDRLISATLATTPGSPAPPPSDPAEGPLELCPVIYQPDEQRRRIADAAKRFEELLVREVSGEKQGHWSAGAGAAAICFAIAIGTLACRMKAEGFSGEKEWRLITFPPEGEAVSPTDPKGVDAASRMKFRQLKGRIIPYFEASYGRGKAPIVSVRSGPTIDFKVAEDSIERLLKGRGYPWEKIAVLPSAVAIRE
jgi:hypothetical protein